MQSLMYVNAPLASINLAEIKATGVTIVKNGWYIEQAGARDVPTITAWVNACYAAGLQAMVDLRYYVNRVATRDLSAAAAIIAAVDSLPGTYGYYTDDESNGDDYSIADRLTVYNYIKARTSKPTMEVHYRVDAVPGHAAHYPTDGTIVHDIYGIDYYLGEVYDFDATAWQAYIDAEYAKLTAVDKLSLTHVLQCFGSTDPKTPPDNNLQTVQYPRTISPNNWQTWGVSFFTWRRDGNPEWNIPTSAGYEYLQADIAAVNEVAAPDGLPRTINGQAVQCLPTTGDTPGEMFRIFDNGVEKYFPLVATDSPQASTIRGFFGGQVWAVAKAAANTARRPRGLSLGLRLGM